MLRNLMGESILACGKLHKAFKGKPTTAFGEDYARSEVSKSIVSDEDWEELDLEAASTIRLCLAKNILANVSRISTAKGLWKKLE